MGFAAAAAFSTSSGQSLELRRQLHEGPDLCSLSLHKSVLFNQMKAQLFCQVIHAFQHSHLSSEVLRKVRKAKMHQTLHSRNEYRRQVSFSFLGAQAWSLFHRLIFREFCHDWEAVVHHAPSWIKLSSRAGSRAAGDGR